MVEQSAWCVAHGADERIVLHLLREHGHVFPQLNAGHLGGDRLELTANIGRRLRLWIPDVEVARPALQKHHQYGLGCGKALAAIQARGSSRPSLPRKEVGQIQPEQPDGTGTQQFAARRSVTQPACGTWNNKHGGIIYARFTRYIRSRSLRAMAIDFSRASATGPTVTMIIESPFCTINKPAT